MICKQFFQKHGYDSFTFLYECQKQIHINFKKQLRDHKSEYYLNPKDYESPAAYDTAIPAELLVDRHNPTTVLCHD